MTENRETVLSADHEVTVARSEWRRPEWRKLSAEESASTTGGNNVDGIFS